MFVIFSVSLFYNFALVNGTLEKTARYLLYACRKFPGLLPFALYLAAAGIAALGAGFFTVMAFMAPISLVICEESKMDKLVGAVAVNCGALSGANFMTSGSGIVFRGLMDEGGYLYLMLVMIIVVLVFPILRLSPDANFQAPLFPGNDPDITPFRIFDRTDPGLYVPCRFDGVLLYRMGQSFIQCRPDRHAVDKFYRIQILMHVKEHVHTIPFRLIPSICNFFILPASCFRKFFPATQMPAKATAQPTYPHAALPAAGTRRQPRTTPPQNP